MISQNDTQKNVNLGVKNVIAIISGKGGVGKSLVTSLLASKFQNKGFNTGILDADITGPSIPKMFGVSEVLQSDGEHIIPSISSNGTKVVSINLLLKEETQPVLWRGPIIASTVRQFWQDTLWGNIDYLFVDMPPGTGDVPLTVFQLLPVKGAIIVATPQELVSMIVKKAINMVKQMNIPIIGLVENMSYFKCPDCGKISYIYGKSQIEQVADENNTKVIEKIPFDTKISDLCDLGQIYNYNNGLFDNITDIF